MSFETEDWYYKAAKHFGPKRADNPRHIIIHSAETPMTAGAARRIQNYFARGNVKASSHVMIDNKEIVQCVYDSYVAYAAPGANHDGIQIEQAGYAKQTRSQWLSKSYGMDMINLVARCVAQYSLKYDIPLDLLSVNELRKNHKGIAYHDTVSKAFGRSSHWDPGYNYPIDIVLDLADDYRDHYSGDSTAPPATRDPLPPFDYEVVVTYASEAERTAAHALGHAHTFRVLPADHPFFVGIEWSLGYETKHKYREVLMGADAKETGEAIATHICSSNIADRLRSLGRQLSDKRKKGEET